MKKTLITIVVIAAVLAAALFGMTRSYKASEAYTEKGFPENVTVNGVEAGGLSYDELKKDVSDEWNSHSVVVKDEFNKTIEEYSDFGCTYDIKGEIEGLKENNLLVMTLNHYLRIPADLTMTMYIDQADREFKDHVYSSEFLQSPGAKASTDAYIDFSSEDFDIVPETWGKKISKDKFFNALLRHVETGSFIIPFEEEQFYAGPKVKADDEELLAYQKFCREHLNQKIEYDMGGESFTVKVEDLAGLYKGDHSGDIDEDAVARYVEGMAAEYNNVGATREFTTPDGKDVVVYGGTYGWTIDQEKEKARLIKDLKSAKDVKRKPVYSFESYGDYTRSVGKTYIDVDFSSQKVKFWKDGKLAFTTPVVTGNRNAGNATPQGSYYILNKVRNITLRGENNDGSEYESPVKYWMGITWQGVGFHDADWRGSFGGSIWISNGSHGCVNVPPSKMGTFYNMTEEGMPVIMHY